MRKVVRFWLWCESLSAGALMWGISKQVPMTGTGSKAEEFAIAEMAHYSRISLQSLGWKTHLSMSGL